MFSLQLSKVTLAALSGAAIIGMAACAQLPGTSKPAVASSLQLRQGQLSYIKQGAGPAVVIVHGVGGTKEDWVGIATQLSRDHTVYSIDMLGFGASSKDVPDLTIPVQADAIKELLHREGIPEVSLIGNSLGAWVAATFAAKHPQLTNRLVLVDAAGFKAMFNGRPPVNLFPETLDEMQKLQTYLLSSEWAHTRAYAEKALAKLDASGTKQAAQGVLKGLYVSAKLDDIGSQIQSPTLIVWGSADKLFPLPVADMVAGMVPGARKEVIAEAGHFPHVDRPEAFLLAVAPFLKP